MSLTNEVKAQGEKFAEQCYNVGVLEERTRVIALLAKERAEFTHPTSFSYRKELERLMVLIGGPND